MYAHNWQENRNRLILNRVQGLAIALFGAGVCYGLQSVCVKELSLQEKPMMAMETLAFRSCFQVLVFLPATILSGSNIIPAKGKINPWVSKWGHPGLKFDHPFRISLHRISNCDLVYFRNHR